MLSTVVKIASMFHTHVLQGNLHAHVVYIMLWLLGSHDASVGSYDTVYMSADCHVLTSQILTLV